MNPSNEKNWYKFWEENGLFQADPKSNKKPYSLLMPPPNLTGELHLGHAMQHVILDAIARFRRMQGFDVLLLPGVDHAGILFEGTLEKLLAKEGLSKQNLGREAWLKKAWEFKDRIYQSFRQNWTVFGISADWSREVFTLDEKRQKAVFEEFKKYYDDGLIYKGAYIVQWCPKCGTAIEDVEMEYQERKEKLYFIKYKILGADAYIKIATARPETIAADVAVAIYPNHPQYAKYLGKKVENPFTHSEILIIEDSRVDKDFGTGALKITPGHDPLDYEIGKGHGLPILHVINKTGKITEIDPILQGKDILEARKEAVRILKENGAVEDEKEYTHSVPVCERCKTVIEPLISEEWFVKMDTLAKPAIEAIKKDKINFYPKSYAKILIDWLKNIHDWCISRNLWWGHRIPVWYKSNEIKISPDSPGQGWVQEEKLLDTWFSSGLWPISTLGWPFDSAQGKPEESDEMKRYFPWDFEITAPEIKYLWIARMIMISLYLKKEIPFKNMFFHGMLRDLQGRKFSKSLGNGIDPNELRNQWGTDAVRMALYTYSIPGRDGKTSKALMDERCKNFRNFATKIRNLYRFIYELCPETGDAEEGSLRRARRYSEDGRRETGAAGPVLFEHDEDIEIIQCLNGTIDQVTKYLENYQLHLAVDELYDFIWHKFADSFVEWSKKRRAAAQPCLEYVFQTCLRLLHPFMPFTTEELWQKIPHKGKPVLSEVEGSIMLAKWPKWPEAKFSANSPQN